MVVSSRPSLSLLLLPSLALDSCLPQVNVAPDEFSKPSPCSSKGLITRPTKMVSYIGKHVPNSCHRLRQQMVPGIHWLAATASGANQNGWEAGKTAALQDQQGWAPMAGRGGLGRLPGTRSPCELAEDICTHVPCRASLLRYFPPRTRQDSQCARHQPGRSGLEERWLGGASGRSQEPGQKMGVPF